MKRYIKDGKIKNSNQIIIHKDGKQIINPKEEMILADGWVEYIYVAPEITLSDSKRDKCNEITYYDSSSMVNEFYINGIPVWLDKTTRVGLKLRFESEIAMGKEETSLWYNGVQFPLSLENAMQILFAIEIYASACYDNTQRHLAAIDKLESIDEVINYDFTTGYPEKLEF